MKPILIALTIVVVIGGAATAFFLSQSKQAAKKDAERIEKINKDLNETMKLFKPDTETQLRFGQSKKKEDSNKKTEQ